MLIASTNSLNKRVQMAWNKWARWPKYMGDVHPRVPVDRMPWTKRSVRVFLRSSMSQASSTHIALKKETLVAGLRRTVPCQTGSSCDPSRGERDNTLPQTDTSGWAKNVAFGTNGAS